MIARPTKFCPNGCGRVVSPDLGCRHCSTLRDYWHKAQHAHPELSREDCILIGEIAAGIFEACVRNHGRGPDIHSSKTMDMAVSTAWELMRPSLCYREEPKI